MGLIDSIAPEWALKRAVARQRLQRLNDTKIKRTEYDSSTRTRRNYDYKSPLTSADSAIQSASPTWRKKVRQLEYTQPFVAGPIKRIANNVIGKGFILRSKAERVDLQKAIESYFKKWSMIADIQRINTFSDILRVAYMTLVRDGEVILIGRESKYKHRITPYCLQLIEVDRLVTPKKYAQDPQVKDGIRYDEDDAPVEYYILKQHPGNTLFSVPSLQGMHRFETIKADYDNGERRVLHLFNPIRPEQTRGFSQFASSLEDFENLDKYTDAEIYAAIEDACLTGIIKTDNADDWQQDSTIQHPTEPNERLHEFGVNQMLYLNQNEDITIHSPSRPNTQLSAMVNQLLRGPANAIDIPPEILSQDFQGMNYSNARVVLLNFYHSMRIRQRYMIDHACTYIFNNFIKSLAISGKIKANDVEEALKHTWIPNGWQWVDPMKEAAGKALEVANKFTSPSAVIASRGDDPDEVFDQWEKDNERLKAMSAAPEVIPEVVEEIDEEDIEDEENEEENEE